MDELNKNFNVELDENLFLLSFDTTDIRYRNRQGQVFIENPCSALTAYCFFENKPQALSVNVENKDVQHPLCGGLSRTRATNLLSMF
ncbi:hypothetical protein [Prevotella koreensis]